MSLAYFITLLSDSCIIIAITLAASSGGSPLQWGIAFGVSHALFGILGNFASAWLAEVSHATSHIVVLAGILLLFRHLTHHERFHAHGHKKCGCEHSHPGYRFVWGTSLSFSFHALALGAIAREFFVTVSPTTLTTIIIGSGVIVGCFVAALINLGERFSGRILQVMDRCPGVPAALLAGIASYIIFSLITEHSPLAENYHLILASVLTALCLYVGWSFNTRLLQDAKRKAVLTRH